MKSDDCAERGGDVLLAKDVTVLLRCGKTKVYELFETGELAGFRLGAGVRIYRESVNQYKASQSNSPPVPAPAVTTPTKHPRKKTAPLHPPSIGGYGHGL